MSRWDWDEIMEAEDTGEDVVRVDGEFVIPLQVVIPQDLYNAWQEGDEEAGELVTTLIQNQAWDECKHVDYVPDTSLRFTEAWLIDGEQGQPISRLKDLTK